MPRISKSAGNDVDIMLGVPPNPQTIITTHHRTPPHKHVDYKATVWGVEAKKLITNGRHIAQIVYPLIGATEEVFMVSTTQGDRLLTVSRYAAGMKGWRGFFHKTTPQAFADHYEVEL